MATIEIDGQAVDVLPGQATIIEVADQVGIPIPRFCYHKKMQVVANCRMCLVEVEKSAKPVPACATPVSDGMKVFTTSPKAKDAQKAVMEFLLINHPLDCPICDQGGECELQDVSLEYGSDVSQFTEKKRVVADQNLGPLIATDMTRCIHCTRCIRFGADIAGFPELGATGRNEHMRIGTYIEHTIEAEVSGNMIDVCPVGALTSKPFRFTARGWELQQTFAVSPHDSFGSHLNIHVRNGKIMRVVPREMESINEMWISDRDRFSYEGLYGPHRLTKPMVKNKNGKWAVVSWETALEMAVECNQSIKTWVSPNTTLEEAYLLQDILQDLKAPSFEYRLRQQDLNVDGAVRPSLSMPIAAVESLTAVLLIGCEVHAEQPLLALRLRKAALAGASVLAINPFHASLRFPNVQQCVPEGGDLCGALAGFARALTDAPIEWLKKITPTKAQREMAADWKKSEKSLIVLGAMAIAHPEYDTILKLAHLIANVSSATLSVLPMGANHLGLALLSEQNKTQAKKKTEANTHLLWGIDPALDTVQPDFLAQLALADCVIAATAFRSPTLDKLAHVYLPIAPVFETGGTFVNCEGQEQTFAPAGRLQGESKPGWKVLRVLGQLWGLPDLGFDTLDAVTAAAKAALPDERAIPIAALEPTEWQEPEGELSCKDKNKDSKTLTLVMPLAQYRTDALVREAKALQATHASAAPIVRVHPDTIAQFNLQGDSVMVQGCEFVFTADDSVPEGVVLLNAGFESTAQFSPYQTVTLMEAP